MTWKKRAVFQHPGLLLLSHSRNVSGFLVTRKKGCSLTAFPIEIGRGEIVYVSVVPSRT